MGVAWALASLSLAAGPAVAQDNTVVVSPPPPPPKASDVGPGELSNFSLKGTVTRPADRPADRPAIQPPPATNNAPATTPAAPPRETTRPEVRTPATAQGARPGPSGQDLFQRPPTLPDASPAASVSAPPPPIADPGLAAPSPADGGFTVLPWIVAMLAVIGGAMLWFGLQRRRGQQHATAGNAPIDIVRQPAPAPTPEPPVAVAPRADPVPATAPVSARRPLPTTLMPSASTPQAQPRPDPIIPGAIVSTGLRPWIEVELSPDRALLDEQGAAIAFEVVLYNSGSAAARDVIIEAKLLNAGTSQDVELSAFFTAESAVSDPIPQIPPYARIPLRSAVRLPRDAISEYDYEGRKLFMPLVAISVRYRWSSGDGQSAAGFLVGQGSDGQDKLAPLRIDRGARSWNGLGARRYEKGVRR